MLTAEKLKAELHYDPLTGEFTRIYNKQRPDLVGERVGCSSPRGYIRISVGGKIYAAHRLAFLYMTGQWPKGEVDHRNRCTSDNKFENLRLATRTQNVSNGSLRRNNTSGIMGVSFCNWTGKWKAQLVIDGKPQWIGRYKKKEDAIKARLKAEEKYFGEFAPNKVA